MSEKNHTVWEVESLAKKYLTGVRGAIPLAKEQFDVIERLIRLNNKQINSFLDIGCGDGILSSLILSIYHEAEGVLLDISEHMIQAAQEKLHSYKVNLDFIVYDYSNKNWIEKVSHKSTYDVIISGLSIHHQTDNRKKELYNELFNLLNPGGIFINLEHVSSSTSWGSHLFSDCFIDSLYEMHKKENPLTTKEEIAKEFYNRSDKEANILTPVEIQCEWLREIGFNDVDCYFKIYELAIFAGRK
jgi:tRNA (cmo5U34)-methyltransferase